MAIPDLLNKKGILSLSPNLSCMEQTLVAHFDISTMEAQKMDFTGNKPYPSFFVLMPTELYDNKIVSARK